MAIMKVWAVLFAFVGIQMAWNLQPFVGDRGAPFRLFRHAEGNFYTAILYSLEKLTQGKASTGPEQPDTDAGATQVRGMIETMHPPAADSTGAVAR